MEKIAPVRFAEEWDNVGLIIGSYEQQIKRILVTLDITEAVVKEAIQKNVDLIISHHPILFRPVKSIIPTQTEGALIYPLIRHNIAVYAAHTNLDMAEDGVNDILCRILKIGNAVPLQGIKEITPLDPAETLKIGLGRIGLLTQPVSFYCFLRQVSEVLGNPFIQVVHGSKREKIEKVAVCGGSGGDYISLAAKLNADVYITGDISHHDALDAKALGLNVFNAGHYHTEWPIVPHLINRLQSELISLQYNVEVIQSSADVEPFTYMRE